MAHYLAFGISLVAFFLAMLVIVTPWSSLRPVRFDPDLEELPRFNPDLEKLQNRLVAYQHSPASSRRLSMMQNYFAQQAPRRREMLESYTKNESYGRLYNLLVPEVAFFTSNQILDAKILPVLCTEMARIGSEGDGGKWVCNPFGTQRAPCAIYSIGISNEISFDIDIQQATNSVCKLYAYDVNDHSDVIQKRLKKVNGKFRRAEIANRTDHKLGIYTLSDLMMENADTEIEILKFDTEGAEIRLMPEILETVKICQLLIEIHGSAYEMVQLLKAISRSRFYLFSYEINGFHHNLCEFSFVHDDCLWRYDVGIALGKYLT